MGSGDSSEIQVSQRNTRGYERWEFVADPHPVGEGIVKL